MGRIYTLNPNGVETANGNWSLVGAASKNAALADDLDTSYLLASLAFQREYFDMDDLPVAGIVEVTKVQIFQRYYADNTSHCRISFKFGGQTVDVLKDFYSPASPPSQAYVVLSDDITFKRPGGGVWIASDINSLVVGHTGGNWASSPIRLVKIWVEVEVTEPAVQLEASREVASRMLRWRRRVRSSVSVSVPPAFLDREIMDDFGVIHRDAPTPDASGMGPAKWRRGLCRVSRWDFDPNVLSGAVEGRDLHDFLVSYWDTARAVSCTDLEDGVARLDNGQVRNFSRASKIWPQSAGDGRVTVLQEGVEAVGHLGRLAEGSAKNYLKRSSMADGPTGYTDSGTSQNGSVIQTVQYFDWNLNLLFDRKVTSYYSRFVGWTSGSPVASNMLRQWPTSDSVALGDRMHLSLDYRTITGTVCYRLRRNQDGQWFDAGSGAFGVSTVTNSVPASSTPARHVVKIPAHSAASTYDLFVGLLSSSPNNSEVHVFHAQLEVNDWASSRVVTGDATVTRAAAQLSIENNSSNRLWDADRGTLLVRVYPNWNSADLPGGAQKTVAYLHHDADNNARLYYDKDSGNWVFAVEVAGVTSSAVVSAGVVVRHQEISLVARWTSADEELDLPAHTISIFADKVKGTDASPGAAMTQQSDSDLYLGHENGSDYFDGSLADLELLSRSLRDEHARRY